MRPRQLLTCFLVGALMAASHAFAWGPDGHHTIGAIADNLIVGTHAAAEVKTILGDLSLKDASVWADCVKGIDPGKNYTYQSAGKYPECRIYETAELEAEMSDFVRRNDKNCNPKAGEESCHKQYHYTDVAIQHDHYDRSFVGTRNDDIVSAVVAATHVLRGDAAPAPFNLKDKREALLVLAHYVGDIHQPLHVGAVYLDTKGKRVNPDAEPFFDPQTDTRGGNKIMIKGADKNMHAMWDELPASLTASHVNAAMLKDAEALPVTDGEVFDWPTIWASDTLKMARQAFDKLKFGNLRNGHWSTMLPAKYSLDMDSIKKTQLVKAGAHLAQVLQAIWP